jgi:hypothetical protein
MGDLGKVVGAVFTGGASLALEQGARALGLSPDGPTSVATLGMSDAWNGEAPMAGLLGDALAEKVAPFVMPLQTTIQRTKKGIDESDWSSVLHNVSTFSPMIDTGINNVGYEVNNATGGVAGQVVDVLGPTVGTIIGTAYGGPLGAMGGGAAGSQFAGRFNNRSEEDIQKAALIAGGTAYATEGLSPLLTKALTSYTGPMVGKVLSGVTKGAIGGAARAVPTAVEMGSLDPVLKGAGYGGLIGGAGAGIGQGLNWFRAPSSDELAAAAYADQLKGTISEMATGVDAPANAAQAYQEGLGGFTQYTGQPNQIMPEVFPETYIPPELPANFGVGDYAGTFEPKPYNASVAGDVPEAYNPTGLFYKDGRLVNSPGLWDMTKEYAGKTGKFMLDNKDLISKMAGIFNQAGMPYLTEGDISGGGGHGSSDSVTELLMQTSGTGVGKSKGLGAGFAEGPNYNGLSFMPDAKDIKKYEKQGLYYT